MCVIHEINIRQHVSMTILTKQGGGGVISTNDPPSWGDLCWGSLSSDWILQIFPVTNR